MRFTRLVVLLLMLSVVMPASAGDALTLVQVQQICLEKNPNLRRQQRAIEQAQLELSALQTGHYPELALTAGYNYVSELASFTLALPLPGVTPQTLEAGVHNQYDAALVVTLPVFNGFRTSNSISAAEQSLAAAGAQEQLVRQQLLRQAAQLYFAIQLNRQQQNILGQSIQRAADQLAVVRNLLSQGQVTALDTLEVANRKLQLEVTAARLTSAGKIITAGLAALMNSDSDPVIAAEKYLPAKTSGIQLNELNEKAGQQRPELQLLDYAISAQEFRAGALKSAFYPQLAATATYHYARPGVNFFKDEWMNYYTTGISLQWSLWAWNRDRDRVRQVEIEKIRLQDQREDTMRMIERQVKEAGLQLQDAGEQIRLQQQLVKQERERYRIISEKLKEGLARPVDVRTAEQALTEAELTLQQRIIEQRQYQVDLQAALGEISVYREE